MKIDQLHASAIAWRRKKILKRNEKLRRLLFGRRGGGSKGRGRKGGRKGWREQGSGGVSRGRKEREREREIERHVTRTKRR